MSGHWCFVQGFQQVVDIVDRGGRFLPDHFRPCSDGLFLRLFGDVAFLPHLIMDNEGAGEPGAGCRKVPEDTGSRKGAGSPEAGSR